MRNCIIALVCICIAGCAGKSGTGDVYYQQRELRSRMVDSLNGNLSGTASSRYAHLLLDSTATQSTLCIISGGQTGVEQAALAAACDLDIAACGWCVPARSSDTGIIAIGYNVFRTPAERSINAPDVERSQRMEWNVAMSDATLILRNDMTRKLGPAAVWNIKCAERYHKEYAIFDLRDSASIQNQMKLWLSSDRKKIRVINIVGSRETDYKVGVIYNKVYHVLYRVLSNLTRS